MATANTEYLVKLIEAELVRLDSLETGKGGVVVCIDDDLPDGWVRIADEVATVFGLANDVLERLKGANDGEAIEPANPFDEGHDHKGYIAMWDALDGLPGREIGSEVWNDFHEFTGVEMSGNLGLIVLRTNGGLRYGFAPTDAPFGTTHDYSERFASADAAIDAAETFVSMEKAEGR